jgi:hypothetical protein
MKEEIEKHIIDGTIIRYIEDKNDTITALWVTVITLVLFIVATLTIITQ